MSTIPEGAMWVNVKSGKYWRWTGERAQIWLVAQLRWMDSAVTFTREEIEHLQRSKVFVAIADAQQPEPADHRTPSDGPAVAAAEPTPAPAFMVARPEVHGICTVAPFGARQLWGAQA